MNPKRYKGIIILNKRLDGNMWVREEEVYKASEVVSLLKELRRGECWCERGTGKLMTMTHSLVCEVVQKIVGSG